ncbi:MAG: GNAT family N-acetyltransferase [Kofleriaceae bacterium]
MIEVRRTTSRDPAFAELVRLLDAELWERYGESQAAYAVHNVFSTETAIVAYIDGAPAGCGCFKAFDASSFELKRMFVAPAHRRAGVGRAVVGELEAWARELGATAVVLETGPRLREAVRLYESSGFQRIPNFGPYVGLADSICLRKPLS